MNFNINTTQPGETGTLTEPTPVEPGTRLFFRYEMYHVDNLTGESGNIVLPVIRPADKSGF
jgi:hypothetical protein